MPQCVQQDGDRLSSFVGTEGLNFRNSGGKGFSVVYKLVEPDVHCTNQTKFF